MNLPQQSAPVRRSTSGQGKSTNEVTALGCSVWQGIKCAGVIIACTPVCLFCPVCPPCIACMGASYYECVSCF